MYICYLYNDDTLFSQHSWGVKSQVISSTEISWDALPGPSHMLGLEPSIWCCLCFPPHFFCMQSLQSSSTRAEGALLLSWDPEQFLLHHPSANIFLSLSQNLSFQEICLYHTRQWDAVIVELLSKNCSSASSPHSAALPPPQPGSTARTAQLCWGHWDTMAQSLSDSRERNYKPTSLLRDIQYSKYTDSFITNPKNTTLWGETPQKR